MQQPCISSRNLNLTTNSVALSVTAHMLAFGAGIFTLTITFIVQSFDDKNRHKAIAELMRLMFLGGATATAIGGVYSYFGSWQMVYMAYGISELIVAVIMLKMLEHDTPQNTTLHLAKAYKKRLQILS